MAPAFNLLSRADVSPDTSSDEFSKQWTRPSDVFSVLLILGGDVIARALAQATGHYIGLPSFSFGWVAYSINALVAAVGENRLMPRPDYDCLVINGESSYARNNKSWIVGRMMRDHDFWMSKGTRKMVAEIIDAKWTQDKQKAKRHGEPEPSRPLQAGLCVSVYQPVKSVPAGRITGYALAAASTAVAIVQLGIAAIPCGLFGDWSILMITASGILLSSVTASLPQWRKEKWACRRLSARRPKTVILTSGNGSQHAVIVLGSAGFLDLEDLSAGHTGISASLSRQTRLAIGVLALLWILLLISAAGLEANTWFLLAVGGIGILFNIYVAGKRQDPSASGIPLESVCSFGHVDAMQTLYQVEDAYPGMGSSLRSIYFPGELRPSEKIKWNDYKIRAEEVKLVSRS